MNEEGITSTGQAPLSRRILMYSIMLTIILVSIEILAFVAITLTKYKGIFYDPSLITQSYLEYLDKYDVNLGWPSRKPIKGQAEIEFTTPATKRNGDVVTTNIKVKNISAAPIARLSISETWFDKGQAQVASSSGSLDKPLNPGAVETVTIQTPWNAKMNGNSWQFSHANGTVKPKRVAKLEDTAKGAAKK